MIPFLTGLFIGLIFWWMERQNTKFLELCQKTDKDSIEYWKRMYDEKKF